MILVLTIDLFNWYIIPTKRESGPFVEGSKSIKYTYLNFLCFKLSYGKSL